ncbi:MAG: LysE family transporter [Phycisphaerales bacterium]|jgi:threonine/homoserine/homoserine lactone efflux protein
MSTALFLISVFVISLSGVMAPGPVTAAAIALGSRKRFAGVLIGIGHVIIELPVMLILLFGIGSFLKLNWLQVIVGFLGGLILIFMGVQMFIGIRKLELQTKTRLAAGPVMTGVIFSISNPYFLFWWAAVGLNLVTQARDLGLWALVLFALVHWFCDCAWLQILSWASFKGTSLFGQKGQKILLAICAAALLFFGGFFLWNTTRLLLSF